MKRPEVALQRRVVQFLRLAQPNCVWFHVPNGGCRSATEAAIFKAMGVRAGVSDLIFLWTGGAGVIELKAGKGRLTPHQCEFLAECRNLRIPFFVARSVEDVETTLRAWGLTLRASVLPSSAGDTAPVRSANQGAYPNTPPDQTCEQADPAFKGDLSAARPCVEGGLFPELAVSPAEVGSPPTNNARSQKS